MERGEKREIESGDDKEKWTEIETVCEERSKKKE